MIAFFLIQDARKFRVEMHSGQFAEPPYANWIARRTSTDTERWDTFRTTKTAIQNEML